MEQISREPHAGAPAAASDRPDAPRYRPSERFWPYVDITEQPSDEELAALDPELYRALFGGARRPFSITLVFPASDAPDYTRAVELARGATEYRETGQGATFRHRARFEPGAVLQLRELYAIVDRFEGCEVLIDDQPVPYARELWLPLVWFLIPR
ncbi:MAG: hypothetical protein KGN76_07135 [Acidobacteriota bacterium]|nr:hypothetical protein [Acidobacteriota bacterium]